MKCQQCAKLATLQITEIHGEHQYDELNLCDECAHKYLYETSPKKKPPAEALDPLSPYEKKCEHCGLKFVEFRNTGRLGCPHDYEAFEVELLPLLESIHSGVRHTGKVPGHSSSPQRVAHELNTLRKELQQAIIAEKYEEAAQLRDRIRVLERTI